MKCAAKYVKIHIFHDKICIIDMLQLWISAHLSISFRIRKVQKAVSYKLLHLC